MKSNAASVLRKVRKWPPYLFSTLYELLWLNAIYKYLIQQSQHHVRRLHCKPKAWDQVIVNAVLQNVSLSRWGPLVSAGPASRPKQDLRTEHPAWSRALFGFVETASVAVPTSPLPVVESQV